MVWLSYVGKKGGGTGREWVEARDDAKHPTNVQDSPQNKEFSVQDINGVKAQKP